MKKETIKLFDVGTLANGSAFEVDRPETDFYSRRGFIATLGKGTLFTTLGIFGAGSGSAFKGLFGRGLTPVAWAGLPEDVLPKPDMLVHTEKPFNGEFSPHLLDDDITPTVRHFVRNNSGIPERAHRKELQGWKLVIDGEVHRKLEFSMEELIRFPQSTLKVVVECAGNGRSLFTPKVSGTPWIRGAVACSEWTGVRLRDVLNFAGLKTTALYTGHYGEDRPAGRGEPFSRGIPIEKAMDAHTLVAFKMNGKDLPAAHGFPARLIVPGWVGSSMQKWLNHIWIRDRIHDSAAMSGYSYRIPVHPPVPGKKPPEEDMRIATSHRVKSLITTPQSNVELRAGVPIKVRGHAWAGEQAIKKVLVSTDFGIRWKETRLTSPANKYAWYSWESELRFANRGYYEIWARAFDDAGNAQPFRQPWNPKGYLGNVIHRVPLLLRA